MYNFTQIDHPAQGFGLKVVLIIVLSVTSHLTSGNMLKLCALLSYFYCHCCHHYYHCH